jgi:hypothetical protein
LVPDPVEASLRLPSHSVRRQHPDMAFKNLTGVEASSLLLITSQTLKEIARFGPKKFLE